MNARFAAARPAARGLAGRSAPPREPVIAPAAGRGSFLSGLWRLADPKISLASFSGMFLGACAAARDGAIDLFWLVLTVAGIFAIEVAKNASGEVVDFDSGADRLVAPEDRSPFSGGKRVLVDHLLTRGQTIAISAVSYLLGTGVGLGVVLVREPRILWLGLIGVGAALFYHAPPLRLSYRGWGEVAVATCYGPLITAGTYLVQRGRVTVDLVLLSVILGVLIAAFLWINEFPDYLADRAAGKRNLVVRLGRPAAARVFLGVIVAAGVAVAVLPLLGLPRTVWLGGVSLLPGARAAWLLLREPEVTASVVPAQAMTLAAFVLFALGTGLGLLL